MVSSDSSSLFFPALPHTSDAVSMSVPLNVPCEIVALFSSSKLGAASLPPIIASNKSATCGSTQLFKVELEACVLARSSATFSDHY